MSEATERKILKKYIRREFAEEELYDLVSEALELKFRTLGDVHLENTSNGRFSDGLKEQLDDYSLFILNVERMSPDLTGYLVKKERHREDKYFIVVEIKGGRPTLKDIYQTKRYAEILQATYALLISPKKLSAERRKFLMKRKGEITQFHRNRHVLIGRLYTYKRSIQIDKDLYYRIPEPFGEESR